MWSTSEPIYRNATASPAKAWRSQAGRYRLEGNRCESCDLVFLPKRRVCPECRSRDLAEQVMARTGVVVCRAEDKTPLIGHNGRSVRPFAIVALDDGPHVLTELVATAGSEVTPGLPVELVVRKWRREANGLYQYGYKFRPRRSS